MESFLFYTRTKFFNIDSWMSTEFFIENFLIRIVHDAHIKYQCARTGDLIDQIRTHSKYCFRHYSNPCKNKALMFCPRNGPDCALIRDSMLAWIDYKS